MNPLLSDIAEDHHQHLLERGNLLPRKKDWTGENQWRSLGYLARINRHHCACGDIRDQFVGCYHAEITPSGTRREQLLINNLQIPLDQKYPILITDLDVRICPACLVAKGFSFPLL